VAVAVAVETEQVAVELVAIELTEQQKHLVVAMPMRCLLLLVLA
jgi:hypothetical protein